jgi:hypothetical protein
MLQYPSEFTPGLRSSPWPRRDWWPRLERGIAQLEGEAAAIRAEWIRNNLAGLTTVQHERLQAGEPTDWTALEVLIAPKPCGCKNNACPATCAAVNRLIESGHLPVVSPPPPATRGEPFYS